MDASQLIVTMIGVGLIVLVGWFFFFAPAQRAVAVTTESGIQEVSILVKGGYSPDVVTVKSNRTVQLHFYRDEDNSCSEELLIPDFNLRRELPPFQTTTIELLPQNVGTYEFTCGMHMLKGQLIVE